jgi:hypothetical protein
MPNVLILLRGDVYRSGRNASSGANVDEQHAAFDTLKPMLVDPLHGYDVDVAINGTCVSELVETTQNKLVGVFGSHIIMMRFHDPKDRAAIQAHSIINMFDDVKAILYNYDHVVMARLDLHYHLVPYPKVLPTESVLSICPHNTRNAANDLFFTCPKKLLPNFVDYMRMRPLRKTNKGKSMWELPMHMPVTFTADRPHGLNTEHHYNPYYHIVGRPRSMVPPPSFYSFV